MPAISRRKPILQNRVAPEVGAAVVAMAVEQPAWGQLRVAKEVMKRGLSISSSGVRGVWQRHALENLNQRLKALEAKVAQEGKSLTAAQRTALEKAKADKEAHGEFESECPGYCGAQATCSVGTLKGVGRIHQQPFLDTYRNVAVVKLYARKTPLPCAALLHERVVPFFAQHDIPLARILTDRGTEYCGSPDQHQYELYLAVENSDHTRTKGTSPQTNGIGERFPRPMLNAFYRIACRKKLYERLEELQHDVEAWGAEYKELRPHQGRWGYGKTPLQTFVDSIP